jgi:hypothetical protein
MVIRGELDIGASADEVWALVARCFDGIADWAGAVKESRPDPDAPAMAGVPVAGRVCRSRVPGFAEVRERIVAYDERAMDLSYELVDPPRLLAAARSRWQVTPIDGQRSRVRWEGAVELRGLLGRVVALPVRIGLQRLAARTVEDLRRHVEPRGQVPVSTSRFTQSRSEG